VRLGQQVYGDWGFGRRLGAGGGLSALFSGLSGTGKTMAAGVLARSLGLEIYRVDLSGVVSKYIGETEKNLSRVFEEAHDSSAILFFDEADALFGKRTEVQDAHDRYANIETSYLLQKMESYPGVAILATNFAQNIDEAFTRRLHYRVEFPFPGPADRERIWRGMFPPLAPLDPQVDFAFLAGQFELSGGNIRNCVLAAAFLAAENGQLIGMVHLIEGVSRELSKLGRARTRADFGAYYQALREQHS
jgi:SpoVK/Ycf46/Vps4 family AAA+-type ATPase